jgi:hypothetical protein
MSAARIVTILDEECECCIQMYPAFVCQKIVMKLQICHIHALATFGLQFNMRFTMLNEDCYSPLTKLSDSEDSASRLSCQQLSQMLS